MWAIWLRLGTKAPGSTTPAFALRASASSAKDTYAENAADEYDYAATIGRLERIKALNASANEIDGVTLTYDDGGRITDRVRGGSLSLAHQYTYDSANRLLSEQTNSGGAIVQRASEYDLAGNIDKRHIYTGSGARFVPTYLSDHLARNEPDNHDGFWLAPGVNSGDALFDHDDKGNMSSRSYTGGASWSYIWDDANRLDRVIKTVSASVTQDIRYRYNARNERILRQATDGTRTRFFFHGVTENVKKQSVNTHADTSFQVTTRYDAETVNYPSGITRTADADRRSTVYSAAGWWDDYATGGRHWWHTSGYGWNLTGRKTMSAWIRTANETDTSFSIHVITSTGRRCALTYRANTTGVTMYNPTHEAIIGVDGTAGDFDEGGDWVRLERNLPPAGKPSSGGQASRPISRPRGRVGGVGDGNPGCRVGWRRTKPRRSQCHLRPFRLHPSHFILSTAVPRLPRGRADATHLGNRRPGGSIPCPNCRDCTTLPAARPMRPGC